MFHKLAPSVGIECARLTMAATRFDFEKFTGKNDFGLWKVKMRATLVQQGLWEAMKYEEPDKTANLEDKAVVKKMDMMDRAHSALMLSLGDRVLREVCKEKTPSAVWKKLESIYMTKSLANRLFLKQRLYSIKFLEGKGIMEQLDDFMKAVDDLESVDGEIKDEDKAIMLLNALPKSFDQLKDAILYGRDSSLTYEEVLTALKAKEFQKVSVAKPLDQAGEVLNVKSGDKKAGKKKWQKKGKPEKKEEKETRLCHYCKKTGAPKEELLCIQKKERRGSCWGVQCGCCSRN